MEIIRTLVKNLIFIAMLAVFLPMLLPFGEMQRYVKMVLGLLVMVAILQAVGEAAKGSWQKEIPALTIAGGSASAPSLAEIMAKGQKIAAVGNEQIKTRYEQGLVRQVKALAELNNEFTVKEAKVILTADDEKQRNFGEVKEIQLAVVQKKQKTDELPDSAKEVSRLETSAPSEFQAKEKASQLAAAIANFYNLSLDQVKIKVVG
jgi:stage III sporulation protein AF